MENYIVINGKKAELTKEQLKALGIKIKNPFSRPKGHGIFYHIGPDGKIYNNYESKDVTFYNDYYAIANYCTDEKLMEQRALHETLSRLLWRFSCENGELENEWNNRNFHYLIFLDKKRNKINISFGLTTKTEGITYFPSREIAEEAIEKIVKPFIKEHPDFVW